MSAIKPFIFSAAPSKNLFSKIFSRRKNSKNFEICPKKLIEFFTKIDLNSKDKEKRSYPIAVLTDCGSASAAEILAISLRENYDNVKIIGTQTYGKGTIQKAYPLSSGATVKYTTQKWLTPKGEWLNEVGVTPDEVVELSEQYYQTYHEDDDSQLTKAKEFLNQ